MNLFLRVAKKYFYLIPFLLLFLLYFSFLSRDIYGGDVGDLVTSSYLHGVAHPPGYPLFTFLGFVLTKIIYFHPMVVSIGLISSISATLTVYIFFKFALYITKKTFIAYISSFILAFTYLFWLYAEIAEVFALNALLSLSFFFSSYLFYKTSKTKYLWLSALFLGLGLSNHHTILFLLPSALIFYYPHLKSLLSFKKIIISVLFLLLGLSFYLYVPLAASTHPAVNWNGEVTLSNFVDLVTRKIYGTFQASQFGVTTTDEKWVLFINYFNSLFSSLTIPVIFLAILGIYYGFKYQKRLTISILTAFLITGPLFTVYSAFPLFSAFTIGVTERFHLLSLVFILLLVPFGINSYYKFFSKVFSISLYPKILIGVLLLVPLLLFLKNYQKVNLSELNIGNEFGKNILKYPSGNSLILLAGDTALFNTWYEYHVVKYRRDLEISHWPGVVGSDYLKKIQKEFESENKGKDASGASFWRYLMKKKDIYSINPVNTNDKELVWIPYGLLYNLVDKKDIPSRDNYLNANDRFWNNVKVPVKNNLKQYEKNATTIDIVTEYSKALVNSGVFLSVQYKDYESSKRYLEKAILVDNSYPQAYAALSLVKSEQKSDCNGSYDLLRKAILLNPTEQLYYNYIPSIEKNCSGKVIDESFKKKYINKFKVNPEIFLNKVKEVKK